MGKKLHRKKFEFKDDEDKLQIAKERGSKSAILLSSDNEEANEDLNLKIVEKEVSKLRGLVSGVADHQDANSLAISFPGSPGNFKWEELHGLLSPLTTGKRMSQKRDYEVALVGAFRRGKDKDLALEALNNENQAIRQLAKQREDEILGLKMRLRFREAGIKRLEAFASGKISAETHLLKEKEEHLKEIEVLRNQVDRNGEVTRFAMENMHLKEEIRRLKSFYEEGEQETMHEQIMVLENKLLEALDWKLMHEYPLTTQTGMSDSTAEVGDDNFLISNQVRGSPWKSSIDEENEFPRMQAIHNHNKDELDTIRKNLELCLQEKEKLEWQVDDLVAKLESEGPIGAVDEAKQVELSLVPTDKTIINFSAQMELKKIVDAIDAASQREAMDHASAIMLSKENDELRMKLRVLSEDNNRLIELYERAASESNYESVNKVETTLNDAVVVGNSGEKEAEMTKEVENLQQQLVEMHKENVKLMSLYERAMQEKDELKRRLSSLEYIRGEYDCIEKFVEVDEGMHKEFVEPLNPNEMVCESVPPELEVLDGEANNEMPCESIPPGLEILDGEESNEMVCESVPTGLELEMLDGGENNEFIPRLESSIKKENHNLVTDEPCSHIRVSGELDGIDEFAEENGRAHLDREHKICAGTFFHMEREPTALIENLCMIRVKLESVDEQLSNLANTVTVFGSLEKINFEVNKLSTQIAAMEHAVQTKQKELKSLKLLLSRKEENRDLAQSKFRPAKYSLCNFSSSIIYFKQQETRARTRVHASNSYLNQRIYELALLEARRDEIKTLCEKIQQSQVELRNSLASIEAKIDEVSQKPKNDKFLSSIDNLIKTDYLLKSEEEKAKLQNEIKLAKEKLGAMTKELEDLQNEMKLAKEKLGAMTKELEDFTSQSKQVDSDIGAVQLEVQKASRSVDEMEIALQGVIKEKETLFEIMDTGIKEFENIILEYQECLFEAGLKEAEVKILEEELQMECRRTEELVRARSVAVQKTTQLLKDTQCDSCFLSEKIEEELRSIRSSVMEAKLLLGESNLNYS